MSKLIIIITTSLCVLLWATLKHLRLFQSTLFCSDLALLLHLSLFLLPTCSTDPFSQDTLIEQQTTSSPCNLFFSFWAPPSGLPFPPAFFSFLPFFRERNPSEATESCCSKGSCCSGYTKSSTFGGWRSWTKSLIQVLQNQSRPLSSAWRAIYCNTWNIRVTKNFLMRTQARRAKPHGIINKELLCTVITGVFLLNIVLCSL